ncbi:hypothetical protein N7520_002645 [Penicillium odoratum]|uniref:uncharacterized protein n=1 Tax=Penicillium odoratum TaxID=1167516 RepID=UPI0025494C53|nr:uncharacterized protein N7520_002645 [Penicillium odoratum]KAJ5772116.1 hypothetical protein N7520_002645 [Penicillium odoratum]
MSTANNYEIGFSTDLRQYSSQTATLKTPAHNGSEPAIEAIELETVRFTGDLLIDPNGTIYRNIEGKQYVREPSPDIDSAWRDIIRGTGVDLTTSDAERAGVIGKTYQKSSGHYLAGMHIFHELHCLNKLRKASHPDYYNDYDGESYDYWRQHLDHCIDSLRQTLMCNGDISLVTVDWIEARNRTVPDLDNLHTCRNFSKLQEWALRHNAEEHPNNHPTEDQRKEAWFKEIPA